jgi:hypothetical protein
MKLVPSIVFLVVLALVGTAFSAEMTTKEPLWRQLSQAYAFIHAQQTSLERIEQKFPDLAKDVKYAWYAFNSTALAECATGVDEELSGIFGEKWAEYEAAMNDQIDSLFEGQEITRQNAVAFLQEVHQRAQGEIPAPILSTLLSANPRFSKNPELELTSGWKQTFRTKGHPKAKGVDFSISFPASWSRREGYRPNIIQVFQNNAGLGPVMCNLVVKTIPLPADYEPENDELEAFFQPKELAGMIPDGSTFIEAKKITLEGLPAGMIIFDQVEKRIDFEFPIRMTQFLTIYNKSMIFVQFGVTKMPDTSDSLEALQKKYLPAFKSIANTLVLNDRYK